MNKKHIAFFLMIPLAITSRFYWKSRKGLGFKNWKRLHRIVYIVFFMACWHVITRNWDRLSRGKSAVESATLAPYLLVLLLGYRVVRYIYFTYFKAKSSPRSSVQNTEDSVPLKG